MSRNNPSPSERTEAKPVPEDPEPRPSSADPRVLRSRDRVLSTTLELLTQTGLGGLTIDEVARRSGVAKTTIYRHWPDRTSLIVDACLRMTDADQTPPDTGSFAGDVRVILMELADLLYTARWASILPSIVDAAEHDARLAELHGELQRRHAATLRAVIERAAARGEIAANTDHDAIVAALRGPLYFQRWFSRAPIDAAFVDHVVHAVSAGLRT